MSTLTESNKIDTREQVAKDLDMGSGRNYDKAQYIYDNANEELIVIKRNRFVHIY